MKINFYWDILNSDQKNLIPRLKFLSKDFYLAGGTALALHLGRRTSLDFDLYSKNKFKKEEAIKLLEKEFDEKEISIIEISDGTFNGIISGINLSLFYYKYQLLKPIIKTKYINLASLEDIAAMKIAAVIQRPAKRDYIDLYYLLQKFTMGEIFDFCYKKFPNFNPYLARRAMSYYEDIEKESLERRGIRVLDKEFSWKKAKKEILEKVKAYQLSQLR